MKNKYIYWFYVYFNLKTFKLKTIIYIKRCIIDFFENIINTLSILNQNYKIENYDFQKCYYSSKLYLISIICQPAVVFRCKTNQREVYP